MLEKKRKAKSGNGELNQAGEKKLNQTEGGKVGVNSETAT